MSLQMKLGFVKSIDEIARSFCTENEIVLLYAQNGYEAEEICMKLIREDHLREHICEDFLELYVFCKNTKHISVLRRNSNSGLLESYDNIDWSSSRWKNTKEYEDAHVYEYDIRILQERARQKSVNLEEIAEFLFHYGATNKLLPITASTQSGDIKTANVCLHSSQSEGISSFTYTASCSLINSSSTTFNMNTNRNLLHSVMPDYHNRFYYYDTFGVCDYIASLLQEQGVCPDRIKSPFDTAQFFSLLNKKWNRKVVRSKHFV